MTMPFDRHTMHSNKSLVFSNTVYVYTQSVEDLNMLQTALEDAGMKLALRDNEYHAAKKAHDNPDLFICHDSRDKEYFVRPLAMSLQKQFVKVWYDEFSLSIGDSLVEKIDEGLKGCKLAVIVVSQNLLARKKWSAREYRSLTSREIEECRKVVLPIWLDVTRDAVAEYSLDLADKYALNGQLDIDEIARLLKNEVRKYT